MSVKDFFDEWDKSRIRPPSLFKTTSYSYFEMLNFAEAYYKHKIHKSKDELLSIGSYKQIEDENEIHSD